MNKIDWSKTVNLPVTAFSMRANAAVREPKEMHKLTTQVLHFLLSTPTKRGWFS